VTTQDMLIKCIEAKTPFTIDPSLTTIVLPDSPIISITPIIEALNNNDTVTCLTTVARNLEWNPQELSELVKCLSESNRGIVQIYGGYDFSADITNALVKILKANPRIKTFGYQNRTTASFISMDGFMNIWGNMAYYNFEELIISHTYCWTSHHYDLFVDSLKFNRSIKSLKMGSEINIEAAVFAKLCDMLILKKMTEFWCWSHLTDQANCDALKRVLQANHLQKLKVHDRPIYDHNQRPPINLSVISDELTTNTSITDLTFNSVPIDWEILAKILNGNKNITRLEIRDTNVKLQQIFLLDLGSNTTLTDLTLHSCYSLKFDLLSDLWRNQTLRKLQFDCSYGAPYAESALQKYLESNHSLTDLYLPGILTKEALVALGDGLRVNRGLQKLTIKIRRIAYEAFDYFIEQLKHNTSLTELNALKVRDIYLDDSPLNGKEADDFFLALLKTNKTLRLIEGASEYPYLEERLKENRKTQDRAIRNTCMTIKMIVVRPNLFPVPIEIWLRIFSFVSFPTSSVDFAKLFDDQLRSL
jgi:hypothetical protein